MNWQAIKTYWQPKPIVPPAVDHEFTNMNGLTRATECWRYNILSCEFWLSPNGIIREYIRQIARVAVLITAPALLLIPIITFILASLLKWTILLTSIAWKLIILPILLLVGAVVTFFNWLMFKAFISSRR